MTESMKDLRNACFNRGKWLPWDEFTSSEKIKHWLVINDLQKLLSTASVGEIEQIYYNVVEIAGGRDEYVSVFTWSEQVAFVDVTGDSCMSLIRDVMRALEGI